MSVNSTKSCASCHDPAFAFTDGYRRSIGALGDRVARNAPTLINSALLSHFTWADSTVHSLEQQMYKPIFSQTPPELGLKTDQLPALMQQLLADSLYGRLFPAAFPGRTNYTFDDVIAAIAAYERTLTAFHSPYDRWQQGLWAPDAAALAGFQHFSNPANGCARCHATRLFTDQQYYQVVEELSGTHYRTPTLRNVLLTAPYFHDGRANDLNEVLAMHQQIPKLTPVEQQQLITFLQTLTDSSVLANPWFANPRNQQPVSSGY